MTDTQPATKADLQEFAAEIIANLDATLLDFQSEIREELSAMNSKTNSIKIDTEEIKNGQNSISEDINAFSSTLVNHEERLVRLERKAA